MRPFDLSGFPEWGSVAKAFKDAMWFRRLAHRARRRGMLKEARFQFESARTALRIVRIATGRVRQ
jgi:hypothetical protein